MPRYRRRAVASIRSRSSLQVDTRNILFICGGAFAGLEQVIQNRSARGGIGFNAEVRSQEMGKKVGEAFKEVEPEDLVKFGLIPRVCRAFTGDRDS